MRQLRMFECSSMIRGQIYGIDSCVADKVSKSTSVLHANYIDAQMRVSRVRLKQVFKIFVIVI